MPVTRNGDREPEDPAVGWKDRVAYANGVQGTYAYRPGEVVTTRGEDALALAMEMWPEASADLQLAEPLGPCARLVGVPKPFWLIEELRIRGIVAQPHHV